MAEYGYIRVSAKDQCEERRRYLCAEYAASGYASGKESDEDVYRRSVLQILSFITQSERENIRKRQAEGIAQQKRSNAADSKQPRYRHGRSVFQEHYTG